MKKYIFISLLCVLFTVNGQSDEELQQQINQRWKPPLEVHDISMEIKALEQELVVADRKAEFWRKARFYKDTKKERTRKEKLVYWSQKTVEIRNKITELKHDRSYYQHERYGDKRFYYKK